MSAVPRLRFPEFAENWLEKPLARPADFTKGKGIAKSDIHFNGSTPCIRYGELYTEYGEVIDIVISRTNVDETRLKLSEGNEVLIPASGEVAWDIATAACVQNSGIALGGDINILKTDQHGNFLAYYIGGKLKPRVARLAQGNSVVHLYGQQLSTLNVNFPSLQEQKKIADFLGAVDDKITGLRKRERLLTQYKKGVMQKIFTQTLRFKADDGSDFPDWSATELSEILDYEQPTKYLVSSTEYSNDFDLPVLTAGKTFVLGYSDETHGVFENLPVIIFDDFTTANKFVDFPFKAKSSAMKMLKLKDKKNNLRFVFEAMQMMRFPIGEHKRYWISEYQYWPVRFPSLAEQQKIADFLSAIDEKITTVSAQITQMQDFKKGLLQQMFV